MARTKKNFVPDEPISAGATAEIGALFANEMTARQTMPREIQVARIRPNPFQARHTFTGIEELAAAIRVQGFTSRLRVRRDPADQGMFQLVYGERRLRAAELAGLTSVPCEVAEHSDEELLEIGLAENIQRRDLDPLEEAEAFQRFIAERGYSIRRLAERLGKDKGYIENRLALLRVPPDVQELVALRPDTIRVARILAQVPTPELRRPLIDGVASGDLTQQDVAARVRSLLQVDEATVESLTNGVKDHASDDAPTIKDENSPSGAGARSKEAAQGRDGASRSPTPRLAFSQAVERDMTQMVTILSRWRQGSRKSSAQEQRRMLVYIQDQLLPQLEALTQELQDVEPA